MKNFISIIGLAFLLSFSTHAQSKRFCRFKYNNLVMYGRVEGKVIYALNKAPWNGGKATGKKYSLDNIKFLTPSEPNAIIGLIKSYSDSWKVKTPPKSIRWFIKPPSSASTTNNDIVIPSAVNRLKLEDEMVIIIGKEIKNADVNEASKAIFGYTVGGDVEGDPDSYYEVHGEKTESNKAPLTLGLKIGDGFAPYGPFITQGVDWKKCVKHVQIIKSKSSNKIEYSNNVSHLRFTPAEIVSQLSKVLTLLPGDVIFSGASKAFPVEPGDEVTLSIDRLGKLDNKIVKNHQNE